MLPGWVPLSRLLGSFYVVRPIGRGAGGSVLLAVRADERTRADRELVALKVPDYSGDAARNLSEQEFERLFREEAGALLALPAHPNLARFITFDASAQPKPILVMEFVRGTNLERTLEGGELDDARARSRSSIDLLAGLEAMHEVPIAHLDVKPANLVLREGTGDAVLVDFGLAGRRIRSGCGSVALRRRRGVDRERDRPSRSPPMSTPRRASRSRCSPNQRADARRSRSRRARSALRAAARRRGARARSSASALRAARRAAPRGDHARSEAPADGRPRLRAGFDAIAPDLRTQTWPIPL